MTQYTRFDRTVDLNRAIKKAWKDVKTAREFDSAMSDIYRVQQFYTWSCFKLLVEELVGYTI